VHGVYLPEADDLHPHLAQSEDAERRFLITRNIYATISVIIVAGACGIAAGTPLAILGGIGRSARLGAIVKGGVHLETLGRVDTVVLDKTGTLTFGRPEMQHALPVEGTTGEELLEAASTAELRSEHPLGKAIVAFARKQGRNVIEPTTFSYTPGRGISAGAAERTILVGNQAWMVENGIDISAAAPQAYEVGSEIFVARDGRLLGSIIVADTVRPEAKRAVEALHRMGIRTVLLTGDTRHVATAVGSNLRHKRDRSGTIAGEQADPRPGSGRTEACRRHGR
jgi:Cd2+/Zn2+-exporting ATPase/Cu+-exporting ATPase